jgi:hypothetical protein
MELYVFTCATSMIETTTMRQCRFGTFDQLKDDQRITSRSWPSQAASKSGL